MRRRVLWMLVALTAVLLWAGGVACTGDSIEPAAQQDEQRLRDGAAAQPPSFALELESSREPCTAGTPTEISWAISGGTPPYTLTVDGVDVEPAENVQINCGALTEAETADEDAALAAKTVRAVATDSRGVRREAALDIARTRSQAPILLARTAASGSVALFWSGGPADVTHREYRQRQEGGSWGAWTEISGFDAAIEQHTVTRLTVTSLTEDARYHFQLRMHTTNGAGPASATVSAVAGLTPTAARGGRSLYYDGYDSENEAKQPNSYVFLTDADDLTSGATTFAEASGAEALLLSASKYAEMLSTAQVGDRFTWQIYSGCWYQYRVTEILAAPPTPARKLLRIVPATEVPCGVEAAWDGNAKSYFDETRDSLAAFNWNLPAPNEPHVGADGIRILPDGYPVEGGHTYRLSEYGSPGRLVIDVPAGMRLIGGGGAEDWETVLRDEASGAALVLDYWSGNELHRFIPAKQGMRDIGALFDAIVESAREQPSNLSARPRLMGEAPHD